MQRPLRSILIGDLDFYPSEYAFGVNQAMTRAGHWHTTVNIRQDLGTIANRVKQMDPDVIWGHMLLWAPGAEGGTKTVDLLCLCEDFRTHRDTKVLLHDGDARAEGRFPTDISAAVDLALCNHTAPRPRWNIPTLHWPYFAFDQVRMAEPIDDFRCRLAFAGRLDGGPTYQHRTDLVLQVQAKLGDDFKLFPSPEVPHTLFRTPTLAASADAVLAYGRPDRHGWLDVRTFQYPGAGGVLLHDDVGGHLTPWEHYVPYTSGSADSILESLALLEQHTAAAKLRLRLRAFTHVQQQHSATARVRQALATVGLVL
jgi:glycosyl transferase family 1